MVRQVDGCKSVAVEFSCPNCNEPVVTGVPSGEIRHLRHEETDFDDGRHVIVESNEWGASRVIHHCPIVGE